MIRALILYYLNIKSTHGYEIQRFIQLSGLDQWTRIQSGSIYYALAKLEKEKNVIVKREEQVGSRVRKIYEITARGKETLNQEVSSELAMPVVDVGSMKYIINPMLSVLEKEEMLPILEGHIKQLEEKKEYWEKWRLVKAGENATQLTRLSFAMTIHSLEDQIIWHKELLENLDVYVEQSYQMRKWIKTFEPDGEEHGKQDTELNQKIELLEKIKKSLEDDPKGALEGIDKILEEMKRNRK